MGAGKTSVGRYLSSVHGFHYTRYSQVLSDWLADDSESKAQLQKIGWDVMAGGMQAELNKRLISQLPAQANCAVDGLRHPLDYASLTGTFGSCFHLLFVDSFADLRWKRLEKKDPQRFATFDDFSRVDSHPVERQIDSLRDKAFTVLDNNRSLQMLYLKVDAALNQIRSGGPK